MAVLRNPRHEIVARELAAGKSAYEASEAASWPCRTATQKANARKRAQRKDIQARKAEIQAPAAQRAEISAEYLLTKLDRLLDYNVDDYLSAPDRSGQRFLDVSRCSRQQLERLTELAMDAEEVAGGRTTKVTVRKTRIKGNDPVGIMRLMAQIAGCLAPEKRSHDVTVRNADQMTDDELAAIAARGGGNASAAPVNP